jgi:ACS family hexuronate transporter-like MFS transporter
VRGNRGTNVAGLIVLTGAFGAVFLSRNSLGYLSPYLDSDLHLTGQELGWLAAAFSVAWAASGFAAGKLKTLLQERRALLALFIALGISTVLTATASTFLWFFLGRLLAGASGGPTLPLIQSYTSQMGPTSHRGLRMGIVQGVGSSLIGSILAPLILIPLAEHWDWESSFLLVAGVAFVGVPLLLRFLPATPLQAAASDATSPILASQPRIPRNVIVCCAISAAMVCWLIVSLTFYPSYLLRVGYTPTEMSGLMSVMGAGGLVGAILVPFLSDRFGRRQLMIASTLVGTFSPTALLLPQSSFTLTFIALFLGSLAGGSLPLFLAIIPSESVEPAELPAAIGRVQGVGEIVGGVAAPVIAGMGADTLSAAAPVAIVLASAVAAALLSFGLKSSRCASVDS